MNHPTYHHIMDVQNRRPTPKPLGGAGAVQGPGAVRPVALGAAGDPTRKAVLAHLIR